MEFSTLEVLMVKQLDYNERILKPLYWLIIFKKSFLVTILLNHLIDFSTHQYCHAEFPLIFFDKLANKNEFLKIDNLLKRCILDFISSIKIKIRIKIDVKIWFCLYPQNGNIATQLILICEVFLTAKCKFSIWFAHAKNACLNNIFSNPFVNSPF